MGAPTAHRRKRASPEESDSVPRSDEHPLGREVGELGEVLRNVFGRPLQDGPVLALPVIHITCPPVVHVRPESRHHTSVLGDREGHRRELGDLLQEGDDPVVVHLQAKGGQEARMVPALRCADGAVPAALSAPATPNSYFKGSFCFACSPHSLLPQIFERFPFLPFEARAARPGKWPHPPTSTEQTRPCSPARAWPGPAGMPGRALAWAGGTQSSGPAWLTSSTQHRGLPDTGISGAQTRGLNARSAD